MQGSQAVETEPQVLGLSESFERFYVRSYQPIVALAHALTGSPTLAEELAQEAFLATFSAWDRIDNPEGWVRAVVSNRARSWFRRRYAEMRAISRTQAHQARGVSEMPADTAHFWTEVRHLPRRQAQVIALVYLEDLSVHQAAQILGCSESTARVHLSRGRRTLATVFGVEEES